MTLRFIPLRFLMLIGLVLHCVQALALDFFVAIDGVRGNAEISEVSFHPNLARLRLGAFVRPGIGVEVNVASTQEAGSEVGLDVELEHYAAILRLQSPYDKTSSVYVNIGYGLTELKVINVTNGNELIEDLESPFVSIGFQKPFTTFPKVSYFGEYDQIYKDDDVRITAFSFGFQYNF